MYSGHCSFVMAHVGISCIRVVANVMNYLLFGLLILGLVALFGTLVFACVGTIVVWFDGDIDEGMWSSK